ncbi:hypothetical protein CONCODRAFT_10794 [Conidiobolus coronatus NRRL 28638]|uniref:PH domain-containing protein n=1 Tax=Conidiobolus coronatus (strain ATCC 28846 / CBS 209.66 / NRRL 28638) TaxID=796925 RepID=A0A137NWN2_CONC2|nr:hypothetical protein CONCODRAFT_10794 [Conidiobolus coronatus NRRL 28638]|eukprot:KXN67196.1 hypothetical protein CONCODRAFT_10794 [Conidiobolus coronatus NRRL 28638]
MTTRTDTKPFDFNTGEDPSEITQTFEKRLLAWKHVVKEYIQHFEEVASAEESFAKGLTKTHSTLTVPFKEHHMFIPESEPGIQQLTLYFKEYHNQLANNYSKTAKSITNETIKDLNTLKNDIKRKHKEVEAEYEKINKGLVRSHSHTKDSMNTLSRAMAPVTSESSTTREDPWIANHGLKRQLSKHVDRQNSYIKSMQSSIHTLNAFEESIVSTLKHIIKTYFVWKNESMTELAQFSTKIDNAVATIPDKSEWTAFTEKNPNLISSENAVATINDINYPERDNPILEAMKSGPIQHKSGMGPFKKFKDHYSYLTPAGFLHVFPSADLTLHEEPDYSVDLTESTLGPLPKVGATGFFITQKQTGKLFKSDTDYEFNFNTHEEAVEWWKAISEKAAGVIRTDGDAGGDKVQAVAPAAATGIAGDAKVPADYPSPAAEIGADSKVAPVRSTSFTDNVGEIKPPPPKPEPVVGSLGDTKAPLVQSTPVAENVNDIKAPPVQSTPLAENVNDIKAPPVQSTPVVDSVSDAKPPPVQSKPNVDPIPIVHAGPGDILTPRT